jgi:hypothetical protein
LNTSNSFSRRNGPFTEQAVLVLLNVATGLAADTPPRAFAFASRGVFIGNAPRGSGKHPVVDFKKLIHRLRDFWEADPSFCESIARICTAPRGKVIGRVAGKPGHVDGRVSACPGLT